MQSVLVYNVTHSDLILAVANATTAPPTTSSGSSIRNTTIPNTLTFARPKFSFYEPLARKVLQRFAPSGLNLEYAEVIDDTIYVSPSSSANKRVLVGFSFEDNPFDAPWSSLHLRGSADPPAEQDGNQSAKVVAAYFPLIAQLLPAWTNWFPLPEGSKKHVLLLCGTGRPQDKTASLWGNSTQATAEAIASVLRAYICKDDPGVTVTVIDSSAFDVFDYDQNVSFIRTSLMPRIEAIRRVAAASTTKSWRSQMEVTVSLTEGSPARVGAVGAALRTYKPWYAHLCQLKTFWHERRLLASDVRFYSFERVETTPPLVVSRLPETVRDAVAELCRYRDEFQKAILEGPNELQSFWLRKTNKPVLCVLVVSTSHGNGRHYSNGQSHVYYRGINLEVSQPTGSLCSERNAIGSALAANPGMNRKDVKLVAVLALPSLTNLIQQKEEAARQSSSSSAASPDIKRLRSESVRSAFTLGEAADLNPLGPCGACTEWLKKIAEVNPDFKVMTFRDASCRECFVREVEE